MLKACSRSRRQEGCWREGGSCRAEARCSGATGLGDSGTKLAEAVKKAGQSAVAKYPVPPLQACQRRLFLVGAFARAAGWFLKSCFRASWAVWGGQAGGRSGCSPLGVCEAGPHPRGCWVCQVCSDNTGLGPAGRGAVQKPLR